MAAPWGNYKRAAAEVVASYADLGAAAADYALGSYYDRTPGRGLIDYLASDEAPEILRVQAQPSSGYDAAAVKGIIEAGLWFTPLGAASKLVQGAGKGAKFARALLTPASLPVELAAGAGAGMGVEAARQHAPDSIAAQLAGGLGGSLATVGLLRGAVAAGRGARSAATPSSATAAQPSVPSPKPQTVKQVVAEGSEQAAEDLVIQPSTEFVAEPVPWAGQKLDEFMDTARGMGEEFAGAQGSVMNRQAIETATDLASAMDWDEQQIAGALLRAQQGSPEMIGLSQMHKRAADAFSAAQARHADAGTEQTAANLVHAADELARVGEAAQALATGSARAMRAIQSQWSKGLPTKRLMETMNGLKDLAPDDYVTALANMDLQEATRAAALSRHNPTRLQQFVEAWKMSLLSGPRTHFTNILGNTAFNIQNLVETFGEAAIGSTVRAATLGRRGQSLTNFRAAMAKASGMPGDIMDGVQEFTRAMAREGVDEMGKTELRRAAIPGRTGHFVRIPGRLLNAEDAFFKTVATRQELRELSMREAQRQAKQHGWSRSQMLKHYRELVDQGGTSEMADKLKEAGLRLTFQTDLSPRMKQFDAAIKGGPAEFVIPFVRTPYNIFRQAMLRTPYGIWKGARTGDARKMSQGMIGSGIGLFWLNEAMKGNVTGGLPREPGKRTSWEADRKKPYAMKVGHILRQIVPEEKWESLGIDGESDWVQYFRIEPSGSTIGIAADIAQAIQDPDPDRDWGDIATLASLAFMQNFGNKTWLQGMSSAVNAITDPDRYAGQWVEGYVGSLVPGLVAQPIQGMDEYQRDVDSLEDALLARISPGSLEPRVDILGRYIEKGTLGPGVISPIFRSTPSGDPVAEALVAMDASVSKPKRALGDKGSYKLTTREYREMSEMIGQIAYPQLKPVMDSPGWDQLPQETKEEIVRGAYRRARSAARKMTIAKLLQDGVIVYNPERRRYEEAK